MIRESSTMKMMVLSTALSRETPPHSLPNSSPRHTRSYWSGGKTLESEGGLGIDFGFRYWCCCACGIAMEPLSWYVSTRKRKDIWGPRIVGRSSLYLERNCPVIVLINNIYLDCVYKRKQVVWMVRCSTRPQLIPWTLEFMYLRLR